MSYSGEENLTITVGKITHYLTKTELAVFEDFLNALRTGNSTGWRDPDQACSLLSDIGFRMEPYKYVGLNTFGCRAPAVPFPRVRVTQSVSDQKETKRRLQSSFLFSK